MIPASGRSRLEDGAFKPPVVHAPSQRRLSKMYWDTKQSYDTVAEPPKVDATPELTLLHRKLRIQKDRLITWGLEWSDTNAAQPGDIDEMLEREGFTDVVGSIMSSIKEILAEAERMRYAEPSAADAAAFGSGPKSESATLKDRWQSVDRARFEDLLQQLTTSIDSLYSISRSRRNSRRTRQMRRYDIDPPAPPSGLQRNTAPGDPIWAKTEEKDYYVPPVPHPRAGGRPCAAPQLDRAWLVIEPGMGSSVRPPPYEVVATPSSSRATGYLRRPRASKAPWRMDASGAQDVPVLIEYAPFDPIYSTTGVYPSMSRLERLAETLHQSDETTVDPELRVLNMLGYFEDAESHRFGLVYAIPDGTGTSHSGRWTWLKVFEPLTLLSILQANTGTSGSWVPNLEDRFRLSYSLATTMLQLHTKGVVHQDVTSHNIIFFGVRELRRPYLSSFDVFSESHVELSSNPHIYRHPLDPRQQRLAQREYRPSFDIYGLGLVLLEIGLWMPLSSFWKKHYDLPTFNSRITDIYAKKLGPKCGSTYMRAVESCLSVVNRDLSDARLGRTFNLQWSVYCDVVKGLEQCCAIDDGDLSDPLPNPIRSQRPPRIATPSRTASSRTQPSEPESRRIPSPPMLLPTVPQHPSITATSEVMDLDKREECTISVQDGVTALTWPGPVAQKSGSEEAEDTGSESKSNLHAEVRVAPSEAKASGKAQTTPVITKSTTRTHSLAVSPIKAKKSMVTELAALESKPKMRTHPLKVSPDQLIEWNQYLLPRLERLLEKVLSDPAETFTIDLVAIGETLQTSRPTICVTCSSVARVRSVLSRRFKFDKTAFGLKVRAGKLRRSAARNLRRSRQPVRRSAANDDEDEYPLLNPHFQERPLNGASIGAYKDGKNLPAVTYGGVVLVDGKPYGMTVHHLLEDPSDDEDDRSDDGDNLDDEADEADEGPERSSARPPKTQQDQSDEQGPRNVVYPDSEDEYSSDISGDELSSIPETDDEFRWLDEEEIGDDNESILSDTGDIPGIAKGEGDELFVTQPAIQDVDEGFFPFPEDKDEEHLDSHKLGCVYASSGIRRWKRENIKHEIDWALLEIAEDRLQPHNVIQGGRRYCPEGNATCASQLLHPVCRHEDFHEDEDLYPNEVANVDELGNLEVHSVGRTSGLRSGIISPFMSSVRVAGRRTATRSWRVVGGFGVGGDSGAWVIDNESGRVCGHVLAWCTKSECAYICPMQVLMEDIERTLDANRVELPDCPEAGEVGELIHAQDPIDTTNVIEQPETTETQGIDTTGISDSAEHVQLSIVPQPISPLGASGAAVVTTPVSNLRIASPSRVDVAERSGSNIFQHSGASRANEGTSSSYHGTQQTIVDSSRVQGMMSFGM